MHKDQKYVLFHGTMMSFQQMLYLCLALSITKQRTIPLLMLLSQVNMFVMEVYGVCILSNLHLNSCKTFSRESR